MDMSELEKELQKPVDHEGNPIPDGETPDTLIKVWQVDALNTRACDVVLIRSWNKFGDYLSEHVVTFLDGIDLADAEKGVKINIKLVTMPLGEYQSLETGE